MFSGRMRERDRVGEDVQERLDGAAGPQGKWPDSQHMM